MGEAQSTTSAGCADALQRHRADDAGLCARSGLHTYDWRTFLAEHVGEGIGNAVCFRIRPSLQFLLSGGRCPDCRCAWPWLAMWEHRRLVPPCKVARQWVIAVGAAKRARSGTTFRLAPEWVSGLILSPKKLGWFATLRTIVPCALTFGS